MGSVPEKGPQRSYLLEDTNLGKWYSMSRCIATISYHSAKENPWPEFRVLFSAFYSKCTHCNFITVRLKNFEKNMLKSKMSFIP